MTGPSRPVLVGAGALALALAAAGLLRFAPQPPLDGPEAPGALAADSAAAGAFASRPPFDPARDPRSATGALPGAPSRSAMAEPALAGVLSSGGVRKAMFAAVPGRWFAEGEQAADWTVLRIRPEEVTLSRGSERAVLTFDGALRLRAR